MGVGHLYIIAENIVVAYFKRGNAGRLDLACLNLGKIVLALVGHGAEIVEVFVHSMGYDLGAGGSSAYILAELAGYAGAYNLAGVELLAYRGKLRLTGAHALTFERHDGCEGVAHLQELARGYALAGHFADEALEVADSLEMFEHIVAAVGVAEEMLHDVKALVDGLGVFERHLQPAAQQTGTHRGDGAVDNAEQAFSVGVERFEKLEVADSEAVEPHVFACLNAAYRGDVLYVGVLCEVEIVKHSTGGDDGGRHAVDTEAFERGRCKLLAQALVGGGSGEEPILKLEYRALMSEIDGGTGLAPALHKQLLGRHRGESLVDIFHRSFGGEELAGGYVEQGETRDSLAEVDGGEEIVLAAREHIIVESHAGRHKLGDTALDEFLCQLGVFELLADSDTLAGADKLGQIGVEGMMGEAGQLHILGRAVGTAGESDTENL